MTGQKALELMKEITDETRLGTFIAIVRSAANNAYDDRYGTYTEAFDFLKKAQVAAITADRKLGLTPKDGA